MMPRWGQPRAKAPPVSMGPPPRDPAAQVGTPSEGDAAPRGSATPRTVDPERQTGGERLPDEWTEPDSRQPPWERMAFSVDRQMWEKLPDGQVWETAPNEGPPAWATRPSKTSATQPTLEEAHAADHASQDRCRAWAIAAGNEDLAHMAVACASELYNRAAGRAASSSRA